MMFATYNGILSLSSGHSASFSKSSANLWKQRHLKCDTSSTLPLATYGRHRVTCDTSSISHWRLLVVTWDQLFGFFFRLPQCTKNFVTPPLESGNH